MNGNEKSQGFGQVSLSVVVPCYNEADGIEELYHRVSKTCDDIAGDSFEVVLVNDGSTDATFAKLLEISNLDRHVVAIDLARNYGHQTALSAGLEYCRGQRILIIDADLQDPPELLGTMMERMDEGYDVVAGVRIKREGESWFKLATASAFYKFLNRLSDVEITRNAGDFRLLSRRALDNLIAMPERFRFIRGMVSWIGLKQCSIEYTRHERFAGETKYPLKKMILLAIDAITSFSVVPLRFASLLGFIFGIVGLIALIYTLSSWFLGYVIPGWTSLISIVLIMGSVQLMVLGIFGEYLGRLYIEAKKRPLYFINHINRLEEPIPVRNETKVSVKDSSDG
jgi:glycosyltransferase involved in cell wall biosynthesis